MNVTQQASQAHDNPFLDTWHNLRSASAPPRMQTELEAARLDPVLATIFRPISTPTSIGPINQYIQQNARKIIPALAEKLEEYNRAEFTFNSMTIRIEGSEDRYEKTVDEAATLVADHCSCERPDSPVYQTIHAIAKKVLKIKAAEYLELNPRLNHQTF